MIPRRALVTTLPAALLAGCIDGGLASGDSDDQSTTTDPQRGESEVDLSVRDVEDDPNVEYLEEDHEVRYLATIASTNVEEGDGPPESEHEFETAPFDEWARSKCTSAAAEAAIEHVRKELDSETISGSGSWRGDGGPRVRLEIETIYSRDGERKYEPDVDIEELVATAPRSVDATYVLADQESTLEDVPVYAQHVALKEE